MPLRRIFGYTGFVISLLVSYYYAFGRNHDPAEGLGVLLMIPVIIVVITTIIYLIGRLVERRKIQ